MVPLTAAWWGTYDYRHFYEASGIGGPHERGNRGSACVRVARGNLVDGPLSAPPAGSFCEQAVRRDAALADAAQAPVAQSGGGATR